MREIQLAVLGLLAMLALAACNTAPAQYTGAIETGPLGALRQEALSLVNQTRRERGLAALSLTGPLNAAAQSHAEDMARRGYYAHFSPEGEDALGRYRANGGQRYRIVAENIANCGGCPVPPTEERVRRFHSDWMNSPGHRKNILRSGVENFGFGIAAANGRIYAVQTFAGGDPSFGGGRVR